MKNYRLDSFSSTKICATNHPPTCSNLESSTGKIADSIGMSTSKKSNQFNFLFKQASVTSVFKRQEVNPVTP